jgi:hypothetical protein
MMVSVPAVSAAYCSLSSLIMCKYTIFLALMVLLQFLLVAVHHTLDSS